MAASTDITIRDVAARAGCSIATVSRVVTGNGPVSEEMRRRVVEAALEIGFPLARAFPETRPVISVLVPSLTNPVFAAAVVSVAPAVTGSRAPIAVAKNAVRIPPPDRFRSGMASLLCRSFFTLENACLSV